jgi:hypothetical protein
MITITKNHFFPLYLYSKKVLLGQHDSIDNFFCFVENVVEITFKIILILVFWGFFKKVTYWYIRFCVMITIFLPCLASFIYIVKSTIGQWLYRCTCTYCFLFCLSGKWFGIYIYTKIPRWTSWCPYQRKKWYYIVSSVFIFFFY